MTIFSTQPRLPVPPPISGTGGTFGDTTSFPKPLVNRHEPQQITLNNVPNRADLTRLPASTRFRLLKMQAIGSQRSRDSAVNDLEGPSYSYNSFEAKRPSSVRGSFPQSPRIVEKYYTNSRHAFIVNLADNDVLQLVKEHDQRSAAFQLPLIESPRGDSLLPGCLKITRNAPHAYESTADWLPASWHRNSPRTKSRDDARKSGRLRRSTESVVIEGEFANL
jgi:hypothetical protein